MHVCGLEKNNLFTLLFSSDYLVFNKVNVMILMMIMHRSSIYSILMCTDERFWKEDKTSP